MSVQVQWQIPLDRSRPRQRDGTAGGRHRIAERHHRPFGWKNANAGISRARAGVMRRISMAILRATAQHLLSGLDIIGPNSIYASEERRRQTSASEAEHDEYRGGAMAFDDSFARSHADSA